MKLNGLLNRKKYITNDTQRAVRKDIPEGIYLKCPKCKKNSYRADLRSNLGVCPQCGYHYPLSPQARIYLLVDKGSFEEFDADYERANPLEFSGYEEKRLKYQKKTHMHEAVVTGRCKIKGHEAMLAVMNSGFMMGSMGCVVGEKITRLVERATKAQLPLIIFTASGGARMQEGIFSLMQMAKTSAALAKHHQAGLLYMSILTDPTTGGVIASFASQGDIILSEPGALVGFAGPRVIEQTIRQKLPEGFQSAEFLLEKGQIDCIVPRHEMKDILALLLTYHEREDA